MILQRTPPEFHLNGTVFAVVASCQSDGIVAVFVDRDLAEKWILTNRAAWVSKYPGQLWCEEVVISE